ncbi:hypothetical protein YC2023_019681 [Brassica napus]
MIHRPMGIRIVEFAAIGTKLKQSRERGRRVMSKERKCSSTSMATSIYTQSE